MYLNWDIRKDQAVIRQQAWPKDASLVVLDEIHKFPQWKNFLKGLADEFSNKPPVLVTGSATLEIDGIRIEPLAGWCERLGR